MMKRQKEKKLAEPKHTEFSRIYLCKSVCALLRFLSERLCIAYLITERSLNNSTNLQQSEVVFTW